MPAVRASTPSTLQGYTQVVSQTPTAAPASVDTSKGSLRSSMMRASMPIMASTNDAFTRQFYGQENIPQQRILPAKRGGSL